MRGWHFIVLLLISLVFIMGIDGCENLGLQKTSAGRFDKDGMGMEFIKGVTPSSSDELTDFSQFQVGVSLRNSMLNDVDGELCVYDSLSDTYGGIHGNECKVVSLVAAEKIDDEIKASPEEDFIFPSDSGTYSYTNLQKGISQNTIISSVFVYNVKAVANTQICLKREARIDVPKGISCEDHETITDLSVNPAPVIVTKIVKRVLYGGDKVGVNVDVHLKKIGVGDVVSKDSIYNVDELKNELNYAVGFASGQRFTCNPRDMIIFDENERIIRCSATLNIQQDYINDPFIVVLDYGFRESITTGAIKVRKEIV